VYTQPSCSTDTRVLSWEQSSRSLTRTTHLQLYPRFRLVAAVFVPTHRAFMART
jgi:hypothetical protein